MASFSSTSSILKESMKVLALVCEEFCLVSADGYILATKFALVVILSICVVLK